MGKIAMLGAALFLILSGGLFAASPAEEVALENFFSKTAAKFEAASLVENRREMEKKIGEISDEILDKVWISNFILGKNRRELTNEEIKNFTDLYSNFIIKNYIKALLIIKRDNYRITSIEDDPRQQNVYFINVLLKYEGRDIKNSFRVIKKDEKYFITDIITEGVSFISIQRTDVNSRINNIGFNNFLDEIKSKLEKDGDE
ncbi:MAG: ABC transporter substrate-binding protein [Rickettsiales bacterium]|jgi:ABC-type transporter MlaC component|nr:ABC transporter substrate-binding protein [Rickettsiales bacterium]